MLSGFLLPVLGVLALLLGFISPLIGVTVAPHRRREQAGEVRSELSDRLRVHAANILAAAQRETADEARRLRRDHRERQLAEELHSFRSSVRERHVESA
ncbi:MAG: hypothetical protein KDC38_07680 [Planctomycetes bacterium]|nr:hypothetical protein [Planctomycetota bacterium]